MISKGFAMLAASFVACLTVTPHAQAALIGHFENGLGQWSTLGDVSIVGDELGVSPTQGSRQALLSTFFSSGSFSGIEPVYIPDQLNLWVGNPPEAVEFGMLTYGIYYTASLMRTQFSTARPANVSFDWNFLTTESPTATADVAMYFVWSDTGFHSHGYLVGRNEPYLPVLYPSAVPMCDRMIDIQWPATACEGSINESETGYLTHSLWLDQPGTYNLAFVVGQGADTLFPSALMIDNVRVNIPEPSSSVLFLISVAALGWIRRRVPDQLTVA